MEVLHYIPEQSAVVPYRAPSRESTLYVNAKRVLDLVGASLLLALLSPLLLLIALLIKLDSDGPVFFVQERVGARRRTLPDGTVVWESCTFPMFKFRSMVSDADPALHEAHVKAWIAGEVEEGEEHAPFKLKNDPRITRVGRFLRRSSLDELPQLFNVLRGEMSLVGPRPVPLYEAEAYDAWHMERLEALPGLTGLWQVKGRGEVSFTEMIEMDIEYVRHRSLGLDIKLLLLTIPAALQGRGAE